MANLIPKKRIDKYQLNENLKKIPDISPKERELLNKSFSKDLSGGLTEYKLRERVKKLANDKKDDIDQWELEKVKKKILENFGK